MSKFRTVQIAHNRIARVTLYFASQIYFYLTLNAD